METTALHWHLVAVHYDIFFFHSTYAKARKLSILPTDLIFLIYSNTMYVHYLYILFSIGNRPPPPPPHPPFAMIQCMTAIGNNTPSLSVTPVIHIGLYHKITKGRNFALL